MKTNKVFSICLMFLVMILMNSCSSVTYQTIFPTLSDGKYDSEFPYKGSSAELSDIGESVYRINSTAFYYTYIFSTDSRLKLKDLSDDIIKTKSMKSTLYDLSSAGSATLLSVENSSVAFLTCSHIVDYQDTIVSYIHNEKGEKTEYVESISIKDKQTTYVLGFPGGGELQVLLSDRMQDIAIIGNKFQPDFVTRQHKFHYPYGSAKNLEWGSFVYLFGYPLNYKMVTKAIVSSPDLDGQGSFIVDAVINRGFSGGIVLAIKDGVPNFELVGMVQRVPKDDEEYLKPKALISGEEYSPLIKYEGELFVDKRVNIKYGIAKIISTEKILEFINSNKKYLESKGYFINIQ